MTKFLEGKRVYLRPFDVKDIGVWHQWFNDQEVTSGMEKGFFPNTEEQQQRFFESMGVDTSSLQLAIVKKEEDELIGSIGLHQISFIHGTADISILIGEKSIWGKGYGKEAMQLIIEHAFYKLNLHKVTGGMYATNLGSKKLFESTGFKREGESREQVKVGGEYVSILKYGLIDREWEQYTGDSKC